MSVPYSNTKLRVPRGFQNLLEGLAREVLRNQPDNIYTFAAVYFDNLLKIREEQGIDPADVGAKHEDRYYNNKAFEKGNNIGDVSDPQQQAAATKIQSGVRMNQAQAKADEQREEGKTEEKAEGDVAKQTSEEDAALKIQSSFRGHKARIRVKGMREQKEEGTEEKEEAKEEAEKAEEEEIDIDLNDPEVAKAASKIQAGFRGHKARKELKDKSEENVSDKPSTEQVDEAAQGKESEVVDDPQPTAEIKEPEEAKETDKPSEEPTAPEEEEIDIDLNDPEVEKAAVKIQATFKGFKARKKASKESESNTSIAEGEPAITETEETPVATETEETPAEKTEEKMDPPPAAAQEEEVDIDLTDPEVEKAATKIQASFKGFKARKQMKKEDEEPAKEEPAKEAEAPPPAEEKKEEEEEIDIDLNDPAVADATVKIQAGFKGMMARKAIKKESASDVATPEDAKPEATQEAAEDAPAN